MPSEEPRVFMAGAADCGSAAGIIASLEVDAEVEAGRAFGANGEILRKLAALLLKLLPLVLA